MNGMAQDVWSYVIAAYAVTWVGIIGYSFYLRRVVKAAHAMAPETK